MRRSCAHIVLAGLLVLVLPLALGAGLTATAFADGVTIRISSGVTPKDVSIAAGATVTWINDDGQRHEIRSIAGPEEFRSGDLEPGDGFAKTFSAPGTYRYLDHRNEDDPNYWGTVTVSAGTTSPSPTSPTPPGSVPAPPSAGEVLISNRTFRPATVTIAAGGTVTWRNEDAGSHTATSTSRSFDSGILRSGSTWQHAFAAPGTYRYFCEIHPDMNGTVTVITADGSAPPPAPDPPPSTTAAPPVPAGGPAPGDPSLPARATTSTIGIVDFAFIPASVSVSAGSTLVWTNRGQAPHTATAQDGSFDTGILRAGTASSVLLPHAGTFPYFCQLHPSMRGIVTVSQPGSPPSPPAPAPLVGQPATADASTTDGSPSDAATAETASGAARAAVDVRDFAFAPVEVTVRPGGTVEWSFTGAAPHTVTADDKTFDSGVRQHGELYESAFPIAGSFPYVCQLHPQMRGVVHVVAPATSVSPTAPAALEAVGATGGHGEGASMGLAFVAAAGLLLVMAVFVELGLRLVFAADQQAAGPA